MPTRMRELAEPSRLKLLSRVEREVRVQTREHSDSWNGFFHDGVVFRAGVLYWHQESYVDSVLHEAAHAKMLPLKKRRTWMTDDMDDGLSREDHVMVKQVELARGVPGLGVAWALREMEALSYNFGLGATGRQISSARVWWRDYAPRG